MQMLKILHKNNFKDKSLVTVKVELSETGKDGKEAFIISISCYSESAVSHYHHMVAD